MKQIRRTRMKEHGALLRVFVATLGCFAMATMGYAQNIEQGQLEASANAGLVTGIGTHTALGGSVGGVVRNRIFAYGEFSYIPIAGGSFTIPTFQTNFDSKG